MPPLTLDWLARYVAIAASFDRLGVAEKSFL
jgi:hypothetical protein